MTNDLLTSPFIYPLFVVGCILVVGLLLAIVALLRWAGYGPQLKAIDRKLTSFRNRINQNGAKRSLTILDQISRTFNGR